MMECKTSLFTSRNEDDHVIFKTCHIKIRFKK